MSAPQAPLPYGPILTTLSKVEKSTDLWLWPGRIPLGAITTIVGYGGEGKSFLACAVASAVSRGAPLPGGVAAPKGNVVLLAGEDLPAKLKQRYAANGADLDKITLLEGQRIYTKSGLADTNVTLRDIDLIRLALDRAGAPKLLIIDPIGDFIPGVNSDKDNEVRSLLNPLTRLAQERSFAILLICHRKKAAGDRADNIALGSVAFTAKARAVHHLMADPYDSAHTSVRRRLLLPGKINDREQATGLAFRIRAPEGVIEWEQNPVAITADAALHYAAAKAKAERDADPHMLSDAERWLRASLQDGPRPARELLIEARAEGLNSKAIRRAKERLAVTYTKLVFRGESIWELPRQAENAPSKPDPKPLLPRQSQIGPNGQPTNLPPNMPFLTVRGQDRAS